MGRKNRSKKQEEPDITIECGCHEVISNLHDRFQILETFLRLQFSEEFNLSESQNELIHYLGSNRTMTSEVRTMIDNKLLEIGNRLNEFRNARKPKPQN